MILFVGIAIFPLLLVYIYYLSRSVFFGWISLLAVLLYDYSFGANVHNVAGLNLTVVDVVEISLLIAGIIRTIPRLRERNTARMFAVGYLGIFAFSLMRGIAANGFAHAASGSRIFVGFLIGCAYFLTAPVDSNSVRKYVHAYLYYSLGLVLVACLAYGGMDIGGIAWVQHDPLGVVMLNGRLLPSACALAIAFCFFFSLAVSCHRSRAVSSKWLTAIFLGLAMFLRHRTVWAVLAVGLVFLLFVDKSLFRRLLLMGVYALFFIAVYVLLASDTTQLIETQLSDSATNDRTLLFRVEGWQELVGGEQLTVTNVLFGQSLGGGYERFDSQSGRYIDVIPHNEYVTQFLNLGISGLVLVLCLMILPLRRFWTLSSTDIRAVEPSASAWVVVIVGIMVFSVAYDPPVDAYALLGIANAMVFRLNKEPGRFSNLPGAADDQPILGLV